MRYDDSEDDDDFRDRAEMDADPEADDDIEEDVEDLGFRRDSKNPVDISMEVDPDGNEVWYAADKRIPGSTSMGHSIEEVMDGVEERRRQYREMLRRSREETEPEYDEGE